MFSNALLFLLNTILDLLTLLFLLRFYFQLTRVPFQNQAAQTVVSLTNFAVKPMRRLMAILRNLGFNKIDISTLLLACITQLALILLTLWLNAFPLLLALSQVWLILLEISLLNIVSMSVNIFMYAMLIQAVMSWIAPYSPIAPLINTLCAPISGFLGKFIPRAGNIDLSPLIFIIAAQLLQFTVLIPLKNHLLSLL